MLDNCISSCRSYLFKLPSASDSDTWTGRLRAVMIPVVGVRSFFPSRKKGALLAHALSSLKSLMNTYTVHFMQRRTPFLLFFF